MEQQPSDFSHKKKYTLEKRQPLQQMLQGKLNVHMGKNGTRSLSLTLHKNQLHGSLILILYKNQLHESLNLILYKSQFHRFLYLTQDKNQLQGDQRPSYETWNSETVRGQSTRNT